MKEGDDELIAILRFCLLGLVQSSVDDFHRYWNSYHVSSSADMPGGVPDILFYSTESSLMPAARDDLAEAVNFCSGSFSDCIPVL